MGILDPIRVLILNDFTQLPIFQQNNHALGRINPPRREKETTRRRLPLLSIVKRDSTSILTFLLRIKKP